MTMAYQVIITTDISLLTTDKLKKEDTMYTPETILIDDPNYGQQSDINTDKAMRLSYRQLIDLSIVLEDSNIVRVHRVHSVGVQTWHDFVCIAWNRDGRGHYHYLCIGRQR